MYNPVFKTLNRMAGGGGMERCQVCILWVDQIDKKILKQI